MDTVVFGIVWLILQWVYWFALFPAVWLISAPVILVLANFSEYPYRVAVRSMFSRVNEFWKEWGALIP